MIGGAESSISDFDFHAINLEIKCFVILCGKENFLYSRAKILFHFGISFSLPSILAFTSANQNNDIHIPATNRRFWPPKIVAISHNLKFQCDESDAINYAFERS